MEKGSSEEKRRLHGKKAQSIFIASSISHMRNLRPNDVKQPTGGGLKRQETIKSRGQG